jgi:hypothetical protein
MGCSSSSQSDTIKVDKKEVKNLSKKSAAATSRMSESSTSVTSNVKSEKSKKDSVTNPPNQIKPFSNSISDNGAKDSSKKVQLKSSVNRNTKNENDDIKTLTKSPGTEKEKINEKESTKPDSELIIDDTIEVSDDVSEVDQEEIERQVSVVGTGGKADSDARNPLKSNSFRMVNDNSYIF